jgi:acyl-CoA synthetase (AMP-forming)/AMP-acid ligase II
VARGLQHLRILQPVEGGVEHLGHQAGVHLAESALVDALLDEPGAEERGEPVVRGRPPQHPLEPSREHLRATRVGRHDTARRRTFADLASRLRPVGPLTVIFAGDTKPPDGMLSYEGLVADASPLENAEGDGDDLFGVFYTGGTTGNPRGVMLSHRNLLASAFGSLATGQFLTPGGRLLHAAPTFHLADIAAWTDGMLVGSTHVIVPAFTPAGVLEAIERHGVTDTLLVPTMLQMLLDHPGVAEHDLSSTAHIIYGASPISGAVLEHARSCCRVVLVRSEP